MIKEQKLLEVLIEKTKGSRKNLLSINKRFLTFAEGDMSKEKVQAYIKRLETQKYAPGTVLLHFSCIRRLFKVNNIEWPFGWGESPRIAEKDIYQPALSPKLVVRAIEAARDGALNSTEAVWLALSTVYGLRRIELQNLQPDDLDLVGQTVYIETAKQGRQRHHLLPPEIVPVLENYKFPILSAFKASQVWYSIEKKANLPRLPDVGWHAIRRILNTLLLDANLPAVQVMDYLRWKHSANIMPARYYSTTIVGEGDSTVGIEKGMRDVDLKVFEVHPFLREWKGF